MTKEEIDNELKQAQFKILNCFIELIEIGEADKILLQASDLIQSYRNNNLVNPGK